MTPLYSPGIPGRPACPEWACKYPVLWILEQRLTLPIQEHLGQCRIERDACIGVFGFDIAYHPRNDASSHKKCKVVPEPVTPPEAEELAAAEPRGEIEDNHSAEGLIALRESIAQPPRSRGQNSFLRRSLRSMSVSHATLDAPDALFEKTLRSTKESSRDGDDQQRYVVVPMAAAERGRGVKNSFLQFSSGGRAVLLEKTEQPRLPELLALGIVRFRHPIGE
jgi:hypothetical protein